MKIPAIILVVSLFVSCHSAVYFPTNQVIHDFDGKAESKVLGSYNLGFGWDFYAGHSVTNHLGLGGKYSSRKSSLFDEKANSQTFEINPFYFGKKDRFKWELQTGFAWTNFDVQRNPDIYDPTDDGNISGKLISTYLQPSLTYDWDILKFSFSTKVRYYRISELRGNMGGSIVSFSYPELMSYNEDHLYLEPAITFSLNLYGVGAFAQYVRVSQLTHRSYVYYGPLESQFNVGLSYKF